MCGIVDSDGSLDLDVLARALSQELPAYARPMFIRVMKSVDLTGKIFIERRQKY
jgi:solute carrier family 27 (fatty acid transporter), member 1/4